MIVFEDFLSVPFPEKTKVKFNMNMGDVTLRAWDLLRDDDPNWIDMNAHRTDHPNNNLDKAEYLLSFAQYYPYGPNYYIFGGMFKVEKLQPEVVYETGYKLTLQKQYKEYIKRLIIRLENPLGRNLYNRWYKSVQSSLNPEVHYCIQEMRQVL